MEAVPPDRIGYGTGKSRHHIFSGPHGLKTMISQRPTGRPRSAAKPGATREQTERRERFERARRESLRADADGPVVLYGWHTVTAALQNPARRVRKLLATENAARRMSDEGVSPRVTPEIVRPSRDRGAALARRSASRPLS